MPASKISLCEPGGFYGYVQTHARKDGRWAPDGGRIDHTKVVPPKTFDQPVIWMPQDFDNSSGGQLWVDDPRWGPLSGKLLHTSFGKGWLYYLMLQEVESVAQAAVGNQKGFDVVPPGYLQGFVFDRAGIRINVYLGHVAPAILAAWANNS